jgi:lipoprotein-anchoring transpeptidase ErfK/SrfK
MMGTLTSCTVKESEPRTTTDTSAKGEIIEQPPAADTITSAAQDSLQAPLTLPVLDAFFADSSFARDLQARLGLSEAEIDSLRSIARSSTSSLSESDSGEYTGSTSAARFLAEQRISHVIGTDKAQKLATMVRERWIVGGADSLAVAGSDTSSRAVKPNSVPTDTRIVVNAPAYRMDLYEQGKLIKSYTIGIGYPEFPLPTGLRLAKTIIFNPTWTPPDESWVSSSSKFKVGKTIKAGNRLNPLGIAKIPIGLPSLIHGGKSPGSLGGFDSHGCVGLTDTQMRDVAMLIAGMAGSQLTTQQIDSFRKDRKTSHSVDLSRPIPVELRYETIVAQDGAIHVYRDVYEYNTNNEMVLRSVLAANGLTMDQLSDQERAQLTAAMKEMSRNAAGTQDSTSAATDTTASKKVKPGLSQKITRTVKGRKEIVIPVAALQGKGYPNPVASDSTVTAAKTKGKAK